CPTLFPYTTLFRSLGSIPLGEPSADPGRAAGSARTQREPALASGSDGCPPERLIGVDCVLAPAEVVDDGARDQRKRARGDAVALPGEQLGGHASGGFQAVQRAAGQADRVGPTVISP